MTMRSSQAPVRTALLALCAVAVASGPLSSPARAVGEVVGKAGAVNPAATAGVGSGATRTLELNGNVIYKERISTSGGGTVQLIFVDKSTLSIGQNASIVIDEFVYDPASGTGKMAVSLSRGALRFVGGNTSHTGGATVTTPVATIGIRGGIATVKHDVPTNQTRSILHFGYMTVSTGLGIETIRRPGYAVTVAGGTPPTPPAKATVAEIAQDRKDLTSQGGQKGSAPVSPTDQGAVQAGISNVNIGVTTATAGIQRQAVATAQGPNASTALYDVALASQGSISSPIVSDAAARGTDTAVAAIPAATTAPTATTTPPTVTATPTPVPTPTPTPVVPTVPLTARAFALTGGVDPALGSTVPYVLGAAVASGTVSVSPVKGYRTASADGKTSGVTRTLQVAFSVNGSNSGQTSNFMVATATQETLNDGSQSIDGGFRFSGRRAANLTTARANGSVSTVPGTLVLDADGGPLSLSVNQNQSVGGAIVSDTSFERPGGGLVGQNYGFTQSLASTTTPSGLGQSRQTNSFVGYAAGMVRTLDASTNNNIAEFAQPLIGGAVLLTDASNSRVQLSLGLSAQSTNSRPAGAYINGNHQFGAFDPAYNSRGSYLDDATFAAREAATNITADAQTPLSTVNGAALTGDHGLMAVSSAIPNLQSYFPSVSFCQCEYTRWGFWSDETDRPGYSDRIHLGTWVVGTQTPNVEVPTSGSATYTGHVMAALRSGGNEYVAGANMTNVANFGSKVISSTVSGLDGVTYSGSMSIANNAAAGSLSNTGGYSMSTIGNFYGPGAKELAGAVTISGPGNYAGAGIFQTKRP